MTISQMCREIFSPIIRRGLFVVVCLFPGPALGGDDTAAFIRKFLSVTTSTESKGHGDRVIPALRTFYAKRNYKPVWNFAGSTDLRVKTALAILNSAPSHGLDTNDYAAAQIARRLQPKTSVQRAQLDILLSKALTRYGVDLGSQKRARGSGTKIRAGRKPHQAPPGLLQRATAARNLQAFFENLAPRSPRYRRLRDAFSDYHEIARRGGWPVVPEGPLLRRGVRNGQIEMLRQRLAATKDLRAGAYRGNNFDETLEAAVRRFQKRHGLAEDGIVGPRTRVALNVPIHRRLQQLRVNLHRRRSIPDDLGAHYVFVNMADFVLKVVRDGRTVLAMKVVVGTPYRQTPLFSAAMTYIDFNPYWNIPGRIASEEIAPRARSDSTYLGRQGIRIFSGWDAQSKELEPQRIDWRTIKTRRFPYRLRQDPGPRNPLGRVKFMFPNQFEVYLHDTPARNLFNRDIRTFSHGCIRVEKPLALATHLLADLSREDIRRVADGGKRRIFHLSKPVPVYLHYLTAWVNKDGAVNFRNDVYQRDHQLSAAVR